MMKTVKSILTLIGLSFTATSANALSCDALPDHRTLTAALKASTAATSNVKNGGLGTNMWATMVNRDGEV